MDSQQFDGLAKQVARRGNRRGLLAGMLGAAAATVATPTAAQEATPVASPVSLPDGATAAPEFLFVQHFERGTCTLSNEVLDT